MTHFCPFQFSSENKNNKKWQKQICTYKKECNYSCDINMYERMSICLLVIVTKKGLTAALRSALLRTLAIAQQIEI